MKDGTNMRGPCTFRKRDVEAALRAARGAGVEVTRIEIDKAGKITIVVGRPAEVIAGENPWDEVVDDAAAASVRERRS